MPGIDDLAGALRENIRSAYETDLGDFKRRALLYLNRFAEEAGQSASVKKEIFRLRDFIMSFAPPQDPPAAPESRPLSPSEPALQTDDLRDQREEIELLRERILEKLQNIG